VTEVLQFILVIFFWSFVLVFGPGLIWTFFQVFVFRTHEIVPRRLAVDFEPYRAGGSNDA
jgi:hypothetical protein